MLHQSPMFSLSISIHLRIFADYESIKTTRNHSSASKCDLNICRAAIICITKHSAPPTDVPDASLINTDIIQSMGEPCFNVTNFYSVYGFVLDLKTFREHYDQVTLKCRFYDQVGLHIQSSCFYFIAQILIAINLDSRDKRKLDPFRYLVQEKCLLDL